MADGEAMAADAGLPWPDGDEAALNQAAVRLFAVARTLDSAGTEVGGVRAGDAGWSGYAASRFDASVRAEADTIARAGEGVTDAGQALRQLADVVAEAQQRVARLAHEVLALEDQAQRAAHVAAWTTPDRPDSPAAQRAGRVASRLDGELEALRTRAIGRAEEACDDVRQADRQCAARLSSLAGSAPLGGKVAPTMPATPLAVAVAVAYAPQFQFASGEQNFPMDPKAWLERSDLRYEDGRWYFDPRGEDIRRGDLAHVTLPFSYGVNEADELQIEYHTFYPDNDFPDSGDLADHEGDWERVAVQFGEDGRPSAMGFEAHGHWGAVPWREGDGGDGLELDGLHANVYVAQGGHGAYAHADDYENDISGKLQTARDVSSLGPVPLGPLGGIASLGDHFEDNADGGGEDWNPGAAQIVDARSIPDVRSDVHWGENRGDGNPKSTLLQDEPPDLDAPDAPEHPEPARGVDEIGIVKDGVGVAEDIAGEVGDVLDDIPTPPLPSPPSIPFP